VSTPADSDATGGPRRRRMQRRTAVWSPPADLVERMPTESGNTRNGLGEQAPRRPTPVMWTWKDPIPHRAMQDLIAERCFAHPGLGPVLRRRDADPYRPATIEPVSETASPVAWTERIRRFALHESPHPVDQVGIVEVRPDWVFEGYEVTERFAILLASAMDHGELSKTPSWEGNAEVHRVYNDSTAAARALADHLRSRGHHARGHGGPGMGPLLLLPAAIEAGLGELGKHGSLINRELGSSFRLACVLTDLDLVVDEPDEFGADDFCWGCRVCTDACPPDAIAPDKAVVRGVTKWYVDFDRCLPYFAETYGCGICIAVCPWSTPGSAPRLAANMTAKRQRRAR